MCLGKGTQAGTRAQSTLSVDQELKRSLEMDERTNCDPASTARGATFQARSTATEDDARNGNIARN